MIVEFNNFFAKLCIIRYFLESVYIRTVHTHRLVAFSYNHSVAFRTRAELGSDSTSVIEFGQ